MAPVAATAAPTVYELTRPTFSMTLPGALHEISALTDVDASTVACLQDENGMLFLIDLDRRAVVGAHRFGPDGDYEGLTRVGADYYVLRSDGVILRVQLADGRARTAASFTLPVEQRNIEGLGYDERRGVILVAPKDFLKGGKERRDERQIYGWDPVRQTLAETPVLTVHVSQVLEAARAAGLALPDKRNERGKRRVDLKLRFSSVAVHPLTGQYFILSAVDRLLLVVARTGAVEALHVFGAQELPKPEGLTFLPNGDMLIASEGVSGPPMLHGYAMRR